VVLGYNASGKTAWRWPSPALHGLKSSQLRRGLRCTRIEIGTAKAQCEERGKVASPDSIAWIRSPTLAPENMRARRGDLWRVVLRESEQCRHCRSQRGTHSIFALCSKTLLAAAVRRAAHKMRPARQKNGVAAHCIVSCDGSTLRSETAIHANDVASGFEAIEVCLASRQSSSSRRPQPRL